MFLILLYQFHFLHQSLFNAVKKNKIMILFTAAVELLI